MDDRDLKILADESIPEGVRIAFVQALSTREAQAEDASIARERLVLEKKKFAWNTPLVATAAALITLTATTFFDIYKKSEETSTVVTLEQIKAELAASEARLEQSLNEKTQRSVAQLNAAAEEREFQYKIVEKELADPTKSQKDRASVLLFLVRSGILNTLNEEALEGMAQAALAPDADPEGAIIPALGPQAALDADTLIDRLCAGAVAPNSICEVFRKPKDSVTWGDLYNGLFSGVSFGRSVAVVIGVAEYNHYDDLESPANDALSVRDFLINEAGFDVVITMTDRAATKSRLDRLFTDGLPVLLKEDDRIFFYFSEHGETRNLAGSVGPVGYLVLSESREQEWHQKIGMDNLATWARYVGHTRQSLWVLDSCFSGHAGVQRLAALPRTVRRLAEPAHHIMTAGTGDEVSIAVNGRAIFTEAFLEAVRGAADVAWEGNEGDGIVSVMEIMEYVRRRIEARLDKLHLEGRYRMTPQLRELAYSTGEFFFVSSARKARGVENDRALEPK